MVEPTTAFFFLALPLSLFSPRPAEKGSKKVEDQFSFFFQTPFFFFLFSSLKSFQLQTGTHKNKDFFFPPFSHLSLSPLSFIPPIS